MDGNDEFMDSKSFNRRGTIDNTDYIASAASLNINNFSPTEKRIGGRNDVCCSRFLKGVSLGKGGDRKIKTEIVSVSLASIHDEIRSTTKYNPLYGDVSTTGSLNVQLDRSVGSSWSF